MKVKTRDYGELEMDNSAVITFARPIYGFEQLSKFVILTDDEIGNSILWLQSIEDENICFILINAVDFGIQYDERLSDEVKTLLEAQEDNDIVFLTMSNIKDNLQDATVNLKSPILLNTVTKLACQEILDKDYDLRFPLFKEVQ